MDTYSLLIATDQRISNETHDRTIPRGFPEKKKVMKGLTTNVLSVCRAERVH